MAKRNPRRRAGRDALVARVRSLGAPCHLCGLPIDYSLPAGHPLAYELDELVPVSRGGSPTDPANVAPSHRCCNQVRGNRSLQVIAAARDECLRRFGPWPTPAAFCEGVRAVLRGRKGRSASTPVRHPKRSSGAL